MKYGFAAAVACFGVLVAGMTPASAAEAGAGVSASVSYESTFEPTQGRRGGGGFRPGGRPGVVVVGPRRRNNFGRNVAIGVGAAVIGGIIASEAARARPVGNCSRWDYQCANGSGWACRQVSRYC